MVKFNKQFLISAVALTLLSSVNANAATINVTPNPLEGTYPHTQVYSGSKSLFQDSYNFSVLGPSIFGSAINKSNIVPGFDLSELFYTITGPSGLVVEDLVGDGTSYSTFLSSAGNYVVNVAGIKTGTNGAAYTVSFNVTAVPEPETLTLMLVGLGLIGFTTRKNKKV